MSARSARRIGYAVRVMKPRIAPVVWTPPPPPAIRALPLPTIRRIALPALGEDVAVDARGRLIAGLEDGRVVRLAPQGGALELLANTGGRPLGIEVAPDDSLVVCDATRGLLRLAPEPGGALELLVPRGAHGLALCNNAAVARDGTIYFSDSSQRFPLAHWRADLVEHSGTGRLLRRTPDGRVDVLLTGLQFANGVALAADESFVAVAETGAYRITRLWLTGSRRGEHAPFCDVPGFVDNLASDAAGHVWAAVATPRNRALDLLHRSHPLLRQVAWRLPAMLQPQPSRTTSVLAFDEDGDVVHAFAGTSPSFHLVTGMRAHGGKLYLASLEEAAIGELSLP